MKKLILALALILSVLSVFIGACKEKEEITINYTITFIQEGQENKDYTVKKGSNFTEIPTPVEIIGYDVVWDKTENDLKNIQASITVNAVISPKTYTVTLDANGGELSDGGDTVFLTYNAAYTLEIPTRTLVEATFLGWYNGDEIIDNSGVWTYTDITYLKAKWDTQTPNL